VLANDIDPDASDLLEVSAFSTSALGAAISLNANGTLHYDPTDLAGVQALTTGQTATDTFTYTVSDGHGGADSATVSIQIVGVDDAPVAADDAASTDEDTEVSIDVLHNDFDVDAGQVPALAEFSAQSALGAAISLNADGTLQYDPTIAAVIQALAEGEAATDTFSYAVSDGHGGVGEGTVVVELTGVNDAPVAAGETYQLGEGGVLTAAGSDGVLANDEDVDSTDLASVLVEGPAHGTLALSADGSFSYTAGADFDGSDSFTYQASDGALGSNVATVSLTGSAVNHAPVANANSYSMNEDTTLTVATAAGVLANDTDSDGDTLNAVLVNGPAHGSLSLGADGAFSYTPNANFFGSDSFSYKANDGIADSKAATVGITIANVAESNGSGKVAAEVEPGTTLQYFMRVEGVTKDWVELDAFSLGMSNPGSTETGGAGVGRTTAQDVSVALGSTQAAAKLVEYVSTGKHLTKVEIEAYAPGGDKGGALVDEFLFTDVLVSSLQTSSSGNNLSFDYAKFGHTHVEQDLKGGTGTKNDTGFDFSKGTLTGGPSAAPEALKAKQDDVGSPQDLDYYAHFEGVGGSSTWLKLGSFSMGLSNSGSIGGLVGGKTTAQDVFVTLGSSNALVDLNEFLNTGKHLTKVEIEAYAPGGDKGNALIDEYIFNDVLVTSLQTNNASSNSLSFDFAKFSYGHQLYNVDGAAGSFVAEGFDFAKGTAINGPAPDADIGFFF
jgi:VCBS repeat-containing protein